MCNFNISLTNNHRTNFLKHIKSEHITWNFLYKTSTRALTGVFFYLRRGHPWGVWGWGPYTATWPCHPPAQCAGQRSAPGCTSAVLTVAWFGPSQEDWWQTLPELYRSRKGWLHIKLLNNNRKGLLHIKLL